MKVLLINGSPHPEGNTAFALKQMTEVFGEYGVECEILQVGSQAIRGCTGCGACYKTRKCVFEDLVNETASRLDEFDGIVVGSPVYYGGPNGRLTSFLDRLCFSVPGEKLNGKLAASIVSCRRGGASAAFERLNQYFLMTNMHVVASQYWNQIHGNTRQEALQDAEGLQTMRILVENMRYVLQCLCAGKEKGVAPLSCEPRTATNFIR